MMTDAELLIELERLIVFNRSFRSPGSPNHASLVALKQLAKEVRARHPSQNPLADSIGFHVESAQRAKARIGYYEMGNLQAIAEAVLGNWPAIRAALLTQGE